MGFVVFACFFLSGASGLVFEVLWTRELGLVFGSTTLAIATVLSAFMGGLALGSHLAGRAIAKGRAADPLLLYALCEAAVGLYALSIPLALAYYPKLNQLFFLTLGQHQVALSLARFVATALLLLLPTAFMGATLPLLCHFLVRYRAARTIAGATTQVATLFALNTAGAVVGTFLAGFVLLPHFGVSTTNLLAASTNLTLAGVVLVLRGRLVPAEAQGDDPTQQELAAQGPNEAVPSSLRYIAVASYAVSGAVAMIYQVLWTRALAIVLGSSVYSFTLILLSFLIGLSAGAAITARRVASLRHPVLALAVCHLLTLICAVLSYLTLDKLPGVFLFFLRGGSFSVDGLLFTQFLLCALGIFPTTLAMGGVMPLTMRVYASSTDKAAGDVGTAYALNTIGAITGSFAAGFVILPELGVQRGLLGCAAATCLLFVVLASFSERRRLGRLVALGGSLATLLFIVRAPNWNLEHFSAGLFRIAIAGDIIKHERWPVPKILYYKDGVSTTVSVEQWKKSLALKNNGKVDASNSDDMATQIMVGLMPLLFHPHALERPPEVAVIGFGSGVTVGAVTQFPIKSAEVVELEPAVVEAGSRFFASYSHDPANNPKVRVIIEDGRNFLTQGKKPYDIIISEPSNPWITGVSSLFTVDYWRLAKDRLAEDGVFCQWAQLYEMSQKNIKTLFRSFAEVFPYTYAFSAEHLSSDIILVATKRPLPLSLARLAKNFENETLRAELVRGGVQSPEDLLADLLLTPTELRAFTTGAAINTDDNALIEFAAPRDLLGSMRHDPYVRKVYGAEWPYGRFLPYLDRNLAGTTQPDQLLAQRARSYVKLSHTLLGRGKRQQAQRLLAAARALAAFDEGAETEIRRMDQLLAHFAQKDLADPEVPLSDSAPAWDPVGVMGLDAPKPPANLKPADETRFHETYSLAANEAKERMWAHALRALRDWPAPWVEAMGQDSHLLVGYLLYKTDLLEDAIDHLQPLAEDRAYVASRPAVLYYLARVEYMNGAARRALDLMGRYLDQRAKQPNPQN